jgi:hypothetical protein
MFKCNVMMEHRHRLSALGVCIRYANAWIACCTKTSEEFEDTKGAIIVRKSKETKRKGKKEQKPI